MCALSIRHHCLCTLLRKITNTVLRKWS